MERIQVDNNLYYYYYMIYRQAAIITNSSYLLSNIKKKERVILLSLLSGGVLATINDSPVHPTTSHQCVRSSSKNHPTHHLSPAATLSPLQPFVPLRRTTEALARRARSRRHRVWILITVRLRFFLAMVIHEDPS